MRLITNHQPVRVVVYQKGCDRTLTLYGVKESSTIRAGRKEYFIGCGDNSNMLFIKYPTRTGTCGEIKELEIL